MVTDDKYQKACDFCLDEMFRRVGQRYPNKELTDNTDWYMMYSWTMEEEEKFRKWMVSYFRKKLRFTKKRAESEVNFFVMNYSWTNKFDLHMRIIYNG